MQLFGVPVACLLVASQLPFCVVSAFLIHNPAKSGSLVKLRATPTNDLRVWFTNAPLQYEYVYKDGPFCSDESCRMTFRGSSNHSTVMNFGAGWHSQECGVLIESKDFMLAGVFEGHHAEGEMYAEIALRDLVIDLLNQPQLKTDPERVLKEAFARAEEHQFSDLSGSSVTLALRLGQQRLCFASVGNGYGLLVRYNPYRRKQPCEVLAEAKRHTPAMEQSRAEAAGGRVRDDKVFYTSLDGNYEFFLAMTRMLGYQRAKETSGILIADPDIVVIEDLAELVQPRDTTPEESFLFVVVATDGVLDMVSIPETLEGLGFALAVGDHKVLTHYARQPILQAYDRRQQNWERDCDDMTLVATRLSI